MKSKIIITTLIIGFICLSCEEDVEPLFSQGMITGNVGMLDNSDPANTSIIAQGPYGSSSTVVNADGTYELPGLGNGTYKIEFFNEEYGRKFLHGVQVFGNDTVTLYKVWLYKMTDYQMPTFYKIYYYSSFTFTTMDEYSIAISTNLSADNTEQQVPIRVFISDEEAVSSKNYLHTDLVYRSTDNPNYLIVNANPQIVNSDGKRLFQTGQTLYLIAYVCNTNEAGDFSHYYCVPIFSTADEDQHSPVIKFNAP